MPNREEFQPNVQETEFRQWLQQPRRNGHLDAFVPNLGLDLQNQNPYPGSLVLPGSFDPLHAGHLEMARLAMSDFGQPCWFEISVTNIDKGTYDADTLCGRLRQDFGGHRVVVSNAPRFVEKSELFPGVTFIVGADTMIRFSNLQYYESDRDQLRIAIDTIEQNHCRFLVFGRTIMHEFMDRNNIEMSDKLMQLCTFVERERFSMDISSTQIKRDR